jgi:hypothetical protein
MSIGTKNNLAVSSAEAFYAWVASGSKNESRLLRGQALEDALQWSVGRSLGAQDSEFLQTSQAVENRETKQANTLLTTAHRIAKRRLRWEAIVFGAALLGSGWMISSAHRAENYTKAQMCGIDRNH